MTSTTQEVGGARPSGPSPKAVSRAVAASCSSLSDQCAQTEVFVSTAIKAGQSHHGVRSGRRNRQGAAGLLQPSSAASGMARWNRPAPRTLPAGRPQRIWSGSYRSASPAPWPDAEPDRPDSGLSSSQFRRPQHSREQCHRGCDSESCDLPADGKTT